MNTAQIYILIGGQGSGKTTRCMELIKQIKEKGKSVGGILALGKWEENVRTAFDLMDIQSGETWPFASREKIDDWQKIKTFYFNPQAIVQGEKIVRKAANFNDWIVIDELGKLDLHGYLWSSIFSELVSISNKNWIICVRDSFVEQVIEHWNLKNVRILQIEQAFEI